MAQEQKQPRKSSETEEQTEHDIGRQRDRERQLDVLRVDDVDALDRPGEHTAERAGAPGIEWRHGHGDDYRGGAG